jgi:DNA-binding NarL/FixJ family response regulator
LLKETFMNGSLRVVIADDERPARSFLASMLRGFEDVSLVGEAENGAEAVEVINAAHRLRHGLRRICGAGV